MQKPTTDPRVSSSEPAQSVDVQAIYDVIADPVLQIWSDALFAHRLARSADDEWQRGTYVRWTIAMAWTAVERSADETLGLSIVAEATGRPLPFREAVDRAVVEYRGRPAPPWQRGPWQRILELEGLCHSFAQLRDGVTPARLFAQVSEADRAIRDARVGIKAICRYVDHQPPGWISMPPAGAARA